MGVKGGVAPALSRGALFYCDSFTFITIWFDHLDLEVLMSSLVFRLILEYTLKMTAKSSQFW